MRKVRVYQLARELKVSNEDLIQALAENGVPVTSHASAVDSDVADKIRGQMTGPNNKGIRPGTPAPKPAKTKRATTKTTSKRKVAPKAPAEEKAPAWTMSTFAKAPGLSTPVLGSAAAPSVPTAPPPARRLGPALPKREVQPRPERRERPKPDRGRPRAGRGSSATVDVTRTYRPEMPPDVGGGRGGGRPGGRRGQAGRKGKRKKKHQEVDEREMLQSVRRTMASMDSGRVRKRKRIRGDDGTEIEIEETKIRISEFSTVSELAAVMEVRPNEVVVTCLKLGVVANINRRLDRDTIEAVADEFGYEVEIVKEFGEELIEEVDEAASDVPEVPRPAIVTVMGHVDHGKTKLLDYIRSSDVISGESGGITQHIGAYQTHVGDRIVTFLDTPGHEAFTAMRARGADVTDIVILMVAADDRVNEQTIEAINHAKAARKPIIVAINKCDLATANPEKIKQQLSEQGLLVEDWGGETVAVEISAKQGTNIDKLLEMVLLVADLQELKAQADRMARGSVIEAKKDPGRGIVATLLIQQGSLKIGDSFVCGTEHGKVRAMINDHGDRIENAGPSTPIEILGWSDVPQVGDTFTGVKSDSVARMISAERAQIAREKRMRLAANRFRLGELHTRLKEQKLIDLRLIVKADVQGSVEVLRDSLQKLSDDAISVVVIHTGVGRINESDVLLAAASNAMIIGFHVRPDPRATQLAQDEDVEIHLYKVIYEAIEEIEAAKAGLLKPKEVERVLGTAEVRNVFKVTKVGTVAGCNVVAGTVKRAAKARVIRKDDILWAGEIDSLKRFKDDVREVATGFDCGLTLEGFDDIQVGDLIEAFVIEEEARK